MEEPLGKDEGAVSTTDVFLCYAHEDETFLEQLEQHLAPLKRQGVITSWHDRDIRAGKAWEQEIHDHLNSAQLVLLLVSPSFISSDYCYSIEMTRALERQSRGESHVIPIIVRPVYWQGGPLQTLQALPTDGKPVASWRNRDEAFFNVAEGIRHVIEEIKTQPPVSPLPCRPLENGRANLQPASALEQSEEHLARYEVSQESTGLISSEDLSQTLTYHPLTTIEDGISPFDEHIYKHRSKNRRKRRLLVSVAIFLALALSLVPFLPLPTCAFAFCHSSPPSTQLPGGEAHDQNLLVELVAVVSPSFVLPDDSKRYSGGNTPPMNISAVSLAKNTPTYDAIIINVQNLRYEGADILIDYVALKILSIPPLPRPLKVWTPGVSTTYIAYPYPVTYTGQTSGQLLYAEPSKNVILAPAEPDHPGETDPLSIQIMSTLTAYLRFQVAITYQITGAPQTLIFPQTFQVAFSDLSNWQEYILQNGSFVEKP